MKREEIWNKAYKRIFELYGDKPDIKIRNRFYDEKMAFADLGVGEYLAQLSDIMRKSLEKYDEMLVPKNFIASTLTAYLLGVSDIDPQKYDIPFETYLPYAKHIKDREEKCENYSNLFDAFIKKHFQFSLLPAYQTSYILGKETGVPYSKIDLDDEKIRHNLLVEGDVSSMPESLADFLQEAYKTVRPRDYNELLGLIALSHGTNAWHGNAENLIAHGYPLAKIPSSRDDVFLRVKKALEARGIYGSGLAFEISEKARKGFYLDHGGADANTVSCLVQLGLEREFIDFISRTRYLSTKALAVMYLRCIQFLTFYKLYFPVQYAGIIDIKEIFS